MTVREIKNFFLEHAALAGLGACVVVFGFLAFQPAHLHSNDDTGASIAQFTHIEGPGINSKVKRKSATALAWNTAKSDEALHAGDQIFTAHQTSASIRFHADQTSNAGILDIDIAENSLIKLERRANKTVIDLSKGFISTRFTPAQQTTTSREQNPSAANPPVIAIRVGNTEVVLKQAAEIRIEVDPKQRQRRSIMVVQGDAVVQQVNASGQPITSAAKKAEPTQFSLSSKQVLNFDADTGLGQIETLAHVPEPKPHLLPAVPDSSKTLDIEPTWPTPRSLPPPVLQYQYDFHIPPPPPAGSNALYAPPYPSSQKARAWWAILLDFIMGTEQSLAVENDTSKSTAVVITWPSIAGASSYRLELAKAPDFKQLILDETVAQTFWRWSQAQPGRYYFRATAIDAQGRPGLTSKVAHLRVRYAAPPLYYPMPRANISLQPEKALEFRWMNTPAARAFTLELAADKDFSHNRVAQELKNTGRVEMHLSPGRYFWRVQTTYADHQTTSTTRSFTLVTSQTHAKQASEISSNLPPPSFLPPSSPPQAQPEPQPASSKPAVELKAVAPKAVELKAVPPKETKKLLASRGDSDAHLGLETTASKSITALSSTLQLSLAYAPSLITNTMSSNEVNNSLSVTAMNSFDLSINYWTNKLGFGASYQRKQATLYEDAKQNSDTPDQQALVYAPQEFSAQAQYRWQPTTLPKLLLQARTGYEYKTFYSYFAESRTAINLVPAATHNACVGFGLSLLTSTTESGEARASYARPLAASGVIVDGGSHLQLDTSYRWSLTPRLATLVGYRYSTAHYIFFDQPHDLDGELSETAHSLLGGIGYGF